MFSRKFLVIFLISPSLYGAPGDLSYEAGESVILNGEHVAENAMKIKTKLFGGTGLIEGKKVYIACDNFNFAGTIIYHEECIIFIKGDFNQKQTELLQARAEILRPKECNQEIRIIIHDWDNDMFSQESLEKATNKAIFDDHLSSSEDKIRSTLRQLRFLAFTNNLNEELIIKNIQQKIDAKIVKDESNKKLVLIKHLLNNIKDI